MSITRILKACNDNENNPKKRDHMEAVAFYLENKDMIERFVASLSEEERVLWYRA